MFVCTYVRMYVCMYGCMFVCVCVYIYIKLRKFHLFVKFTKRIFYISKDLNQKS